ncbi:MAG TPA: LysR family transcriptional regulator [Chondromyces sp.]|nr:LysR family transcriptional regulator [Chondromyces sp.]
MEQKLKVFLAVAEHLNFSRAAESLFITQPAVSQYVKSLEQEMNVKLIDRTNKSLQLTRAGSIVAYYANEMLALEMNMRQAVEDLTSEVKGELAIGASYTFGEYILPQILAGFLEVYPGVEPAITIGNTHDIAEKVLQGEFDLGIVEGSITSPKLLKEKIADDRMYIIQSSRLSEKQAFDTEWAMKETWVTREKGSGTREAFDLFLTQYEIHPNRILEFGSTQIIKEAVEAGLGIALLSEWAIKKELELGRLQLVEQEKMFFERHFHAIVADRPFTTKVTTTFIKFMHSYF